MRNSSLNWLLLLSMIGFVMGGDVYSDFSAVLETLGLGTLTLSRKICFSQPGVKYGICC